MLKKHKVSKAAKLFTDNPEVFVFKKKNTNQNIYI